MLPGWVAVFIFSAYVLALLALALWGERTRGRVDGEFRRRAIYVLTSCVYCSAWSVFGSIGVAARTGLGFLPVYLGPIIAFAVFYPAIGRMIRLAKSQNITSVADFVAARYGKSVPVAATVTIIVLVASIPYIALQIRVISHTLAMFVDGELPRSGGAAHSATLLAAVITAALAIFTIVVGARRVDATEHQNGLMLVIAFETIVRLAAFVGIGIFVSWGMFGGFGKLTELVATSPAIGAVINKPPDLSTSISLVITTTATVFFLPRQFHVSVVENRNEDDVRTAAWFVPLYFAALSLFVLPLAVASLATFRPGSIDPDFAFVALPVHAGSAVFQVVALLGAAAASTSVILVATTVLAIMVSNDLVMPLFLKMQANSLPRHGPPAPPILAWRRIAIVTILALALMFGVTVEGAALSSIGVLSLAGLVQITPAALGALIWRRATARGAIAGAVMGSLVVVYTLALPIVARSSAIVSDGPLGLTALRPTDLFGMHLTPVAQGLLWSLLVNVLSYWLVSLSRPETANERLQANLFVGARSMSLATSFRLRHTLISIGDLLAGVSRYLDPRAAQRLFMDWHVARGVPFDRARDADASLIQYSEHLIASSIGAASSHMVVSLLLRKRGMSEATARQIVDDAAFEVQNSHDALQHAIDVSLQGMAVYDADMRLVAWNRAYRDMFELPSELMRVGTPLDVLVRSNAERGIYGSGPIDEFVGARLDVLTRPSEGLRLYSAGPNRVLEMRSMRLHNGGMFFTYTDATAQAISEEELEAENLTLEQRVHERTEELERLNVELIRAKAEAEDANVSKSRFLAAASHDLLQPLSAARLYTTSLRERLRSYPLGDLTATLASNIDFSLEAVEEILGALLEISHLDAGATKTDLTKFSIGDTLRQLQMEFEPLARERGLRLRFVASTLRVASDRRLLRRMLQNLISNAIKYTPEGRVLVGARRRGESVRFDVYDTGMGIPASKQMIIFREFERLPAGAQAGPGAGLGLSIVDRLSHVLKHEVTLRSRVGQGSLFSVTVPRADEIVGQAGVTPGAPPRQRSLEGLTVAAIDNEPDILSAMAMLLHGWDCAVVSGTDLPEIMQALAAIGRGPDVIVADFHIGDVNGLAVVAALRARYGDCPAVIVTADRDPLIRDMANAADVRVLHKPLKPAALRSLLSQWHLVKAAAE